MRRAFHCELGPGNLRPAAWWGKIGLYEPRHPRPDGSLERRHRLGRRTPCISSIRPRSSYARGAGGPGAVGFRREKFVEFGGPDGGDGGKGWRRHLRSCSGSQYAHRLPLHAAFPRAPRRGRSGSNRTGAGGEDLVVKVPVGTQILADDEERSLLADLTGVGQRIVFLKGGLGGRQRQLQDLYEPRAAPTSDRRSGREMWVWLLASSSLPTSASSACRMRASRPSSIP